MRIKKKDSRKKLYIPLSDIEEIDNAFLNEIERVHARLSAMSEDKDLIKGFYEVLLSAYNAAIEVKTLEREVDYDIRFAEIKERRRNLRPWRRWWIWRLLFQPLTNRAQDIIEERAELDADVIHSAAESAIDKDREKLPAEKEIKLSKRELKRAMQKKLKAVIKEADKADLKEAFDEPQNVGTTTPQNDIYHLKELPQGNGQLPGQMQLKLDELPSALARRPRPPRSCRK